MDREIRYIIICDSFDFFINTHLSILSLISWVKGLRAIGGWFGANEGDWGGAGMRSMTQDIKLKPYILNDF